MVTAWLLAFCVVTYSAPLGPHETYEDRVAVCGDTYYEHDPSVYVPGTTGYYFTDPRFPGLRFPTTGPVAGVPTYRR